MGIRPSGSSKEDKEEEIDALFDEMLTLDDEFSKLCGSYSSGEISMWCDVGHGPEN